MRDNTKITITLKQLNRLIEEESDEAGDLDFIEQIDKYFDFDDFSKRVSLIATIVGCGYPKFDKGDDKWVYDGGNHYDRELEIKFSDDSPVASIVLTVRVLDWRPNITVTVKGYVRNKGRDWGWDESPVAYMASVVKEPVHSKVFSDRDIGNFMEKIMNRITGDEK